MIEKQTIIDQIEIVRSGHVQIRFGLLLVEDGREISCQWHRTAIEPGGDVDAMIKAVNADITTRELLKAQPVNGDKVPLIKSVCALVHTPEVITEFRSRQAAMALSPRDADAGHHPDRAEKTE